MAQQLLITKVVYSLGKIELRQSGMYGGMYDVFVIVRNIKFPMSTRKIILFVKL